MAKKQKTEVWRDVVGYEGLYQVSSLGRVRSLDALVVSKGLKSKHIRPGIIMTPQVSEFGYLRILLYRGMRDFKRHNVHRLVALAFVLNPLNKPQVNHKNGIKADNRVENLEWVTASENSRHAIENGLQVARRGEDNHYAKLSNADIVAIRNSKNRLRECAKEYGVSEGNISMIRNRKTWAHV